MLENFKKYKNMIYSGNFLIYCELRVASEIQWPPLMINLRNLRECPPGGF